ncbi:mitochondrial inner membrane protease subunit [Striga asiatica]|uniref:Mitochondrial inner membrane protease subunit n=1 Tax=Striga asiatica TaxID=4170 RepID=A0A5A7QC18_STRAF|nr:mitochondrial inner membrane protease subunit [Striga asiatica]
MKIGRLRELTPFVKEALQKTARVAQFLCVLHVTGTYLCLPAKVTLSQLVPLCTTAIDLFLWCILQTVGPSMLPTFRDGNIILTEKLTSRSGKVGSGDAVLVRSPEDPTKVMAKRVKAVEGDVVSYAPDPKNSDEHKTAVVPKGHVWIEGDNMLNSRDSRHFGPVPYALIHSKVFLVISNGFPQLECNASFGLLRISDQLAKMLCDFSLQVNRSIEAHFLTALEKIQQLRRGGTVSDRIDLSLIVLSKSI